MDSSNVTITPYTDVTKQNFPRVHQLLRSDSKIWGLISNLTFCEKAKDVSDVALVKLLYLASFKDNDSKSPFSERQCNVLKNSYRWSLTTTISLVVCITANTMLFVGAAFSPLISTASGGNETTDNSTDFQISNISTSGINFTAGLDSVIALAASVSTVTNAISWWATGCSPDYASDAANEKQDILDTVKDDYYNLSGRLITLYFSGDREKEESIKLANNIDIKDLKRRFFKENRNKEKAKAILTPLKEAIQFIKGQTFPQTIGLVTLIRSFDPNRIYL